MEDDDVKWKARFVDLHGRGTAPEKRFGFLC